MEITLLSVVLAGGLAVLVFDTVGSLASRHFGFPYTRLSVGSWLIYALVGAAAVQRPDGNGHALIAGGLVGLIDATAGWAVSWKLGPGAPPVDARGPLTIAITVLFVTASAAGIGWLGAVLVS